MRRIIWTTLVAVAALVAAGATTAIIIHDAQRRRETGASQFVAAASMLAHELRLLWRAPGGRQGESMTIPATSIVAAPGARS